MHIKNLTNSPYSLTDKNGNAVMLPARGTVDIEPHPMHVNQYRQVGYFEIEESTGSAEGDPRDALREEYETLTGEAPDGRWSEKRLQEELLKLQE